MGKAHTFATAVDLAQWKYLPLETVFKITRNTKTFYHSNICKGEWKRKIVKILVFFKDKNSNWLRHPFG